MKRSSFLMAILPMLFCACSSFNEENSTPTILATPDLQAGFAEDTRTYVENNKYLRWHEDDRLTAFYGNTLNRQYKFNGKTGANSGTFSLVPSGELGTGNAFDRIYAVYPYNETATITDEGEISLTLPAVQNYAENSFGKGANTMVAVTENLEDTFLAFKNACGYLKLKLYGDNVTLASIEVKGNNSEKIAGAATATIAFGEAPQLTMADDATASVTIDCGEGITLGTTAETATEFWVVLPETTFTKGLTIKATNTAGGVFEKSTANEVVITRNEILPMVAVKAEFPAGPANNEIWYTSGSTTTSTTPYATDVFGANIVSNKYNTEKKCWIIKFDGNVTSIGDTAFYNCTSLISVTIPNSVTSIGTSAFLYCTSLTSVTIGNSVTSIGWFAFKGCSSLTSITIPDSVTSIGDGAFEKCSNLTSVTIPNSVTSIGASAFSNCTSLTSVTIGNNVTSIKSYAFSSCTSLKSVYYNGDLSAWCKIDFGEVNANPCYNGGAKLYINDADVTEIIIPSDITEIKPYTFTGCISLTNVTIPDSVTSIGSYAFKGCSSLTSITIPNSVTSIEYNAFDGCTSLKDVIIPDSVTMISNALFYDCTSLTDVTIPNSVTKIIGYAFLGCTSLTSVTIPDSVTLVGISAFYQCASLKEVYCKPTTPPTGQNYMFQGNASGRKIYVPRESVDAYKAAMYWEDYASSIEGYDF